MEVRASTYLPEATSVTFLLDPEYVSQRLSEVAPQSEAIAAVLQNSESTWALAFDNDVAMLIEWADEPARIVLSADIGKPPAQRTAEVHAAGLSYNTLWRETGGARICMGGEPGDLLLVRELDADSVRGGDFIGTLEHFAELTRWWEGYVTSEDLGMNMPGMAELTSRA
ncbi:type III secretion system chaperone [Variovorax sp. PBL-E5]|uniref:type III secretion system chaperone n=1 Tax=Variovorax sp. PBL-E5 TaxID=434014 RepID=UPI0013180BCF|nr:type III secretion system chaperone [Variovorax sp. PBL-E5]VTU25983.1 Tir chaperone protein (CesT) [Variovorax sp. PBL-E5]